MNKKSKTHTIELKVAELLVQECKQRESSLIAKRLSLSNKATLLCGGATFAIGINFSNESFVCFWVAGQLFCLLAAFFGLISLFPKSGEVNDISELDKEFYYLSSAEATRIYAYRLNEFIEKDEKQITSQAWMVRLGFILLFSGLTFFSIQHVVGVV